MASSHCRVSTSSCRWPGACNGGRVCLSSHGVGGNCVPTAPAASVERPQCARAVVGGVAMLVPAREAGVGVTQERSDLPDSGLRVAADAVRGSSVEVNERREGSTRAWAASGTACASSCGTRERRAGRRRARASQKLK
ncbi:hypothetical protein PSPO01_12549 [Paraphaeosphaeria sporulosa]